MTISRSPNRFVPGWIFLVVISASLFTLPRHGMALTSFEDKSRTVVQLRREARILHTTIHSTLRVVHDRYYREDEGLLIPAHVLKETFRDIEAAEGIQLRWLAIEGQPMNTDHIARDDFEKAAVSALKSGGSSHEEVSDTLFRRVAPITLSNHCLKCHMPDRKSTEDRIAGLIISIPVSQQGE